MLRLHRKLQQLSLQLLQISMTGTGKPCLFFYQKSLVNLYKNHGCFPASSDRNRENTKDESTFLDTIFPAWYNSYVRTHQGNSLGESDKKPHTIPRTDGTQTVEHHQGIGVMKLFADRLGALNQCRGLSALFLFFRRLV